MIRIARLNATYTDTESLLDQYAPNYAVSANISYVVKGSSATVTFNWHVAGGNPAQLLHLAWAHHRYYKDSGSDNGVNNLLCKGAY